MFSTPNKKGMEVILHFLFSKLDPDAAKETFRYVWGMITLAWYSLKITSPYLNAEILLKTLIKFPPSFPFPILSPSYLELLKDFLQVFCVDLLNMGPS